MRGQAFVFSLYDEMTATADRSPDVEPTTRQTTADPRRWWALALLCGAFFMVILDAAIVTVALPSIEEELGFTAQRLQWVGSGRRS